MDAGKAGGANYVNLQGFEKSLSELENLHTNHKTPVLHVKDGPAGVKAGQKRGQVWGRKVVSVTPQSSLLTRLKQRFSGERAEQRRNEREAAELLHDQTLVLLNSPDCSKDLRERLVKDATDGTLPFLSQSERRSIKQFHGVRARGVHEKALIRDAIVTLSENIPECLARIPKLSLEESRETLKAYYQLSVTAPELLPKGHKAHKAIKQLEKHFYSTRQPDGFRDLTNEVILAGLHEIRDQLPAQEYSQFIDEISDKGRSSRRDKVLKRAASRIIKNATQSHLSIHGHPRELVFEKDLQLLRGYETRRHLRRTLGLSHLSQVDAQMKNDIRHVQARMGNLNSSVNRLDLEKIQKSLHEYDRLDAMSTANMSAEEKDTHEKALVAAAGEFNQYRKLIAQARAVLLDIQLHEGRRWDLQALANADTLSHWNGANIDQGSLRKLLKIDHLRGSLVDEAQLDWIIDQNKRSLNHPKVAIEGAGPTGLTLALTQFEAGADVSVFEKRSTEYNRVQVVRLDPKWMNMLKFYLGEHYYEMFGENGEPGKGIVRPDGFGEIVTHRLEEGLNYRLAELMGRNYDHVHYQKGGHRPVLERMAAYELEGIEEGVHGYQVKARYNPKYDPNPYVNGKVTPPEDYVHQPPEAEKKSDVDVVICAGGKNSSVRNKFMQDKSVTSARHYGVCSWEGRKGKEIENAKLDTFSDFRGMVHFDDAFQASFKKNLGQLTGDLTGLGTKEKEILQRLTRDQPGSAFRNMQEATKGVAMQTRCFENNNLVYIGMEIPEPFEKYCKKVGKALKNVPLAVDVGFDAQEKARAIKTRNDRILKAFHKAWFQTVAESYGVDKTLGLTPDKINQDFAAVFPVQQHRVKKNVVLEEGERNHKVVVTAAGDAAASPHFMRYSGLTGARENAIHLKNFTHGLAQGHTSQEPQLRRQLEKDQKRTADFVIQRGEVFLGKSRLRRLLAR